MTYSKSFFGVDEDEDFDLAKAVEAYEWVLANPDEAPFVSSMVLLENTSRLMQANAGRIEEVTKRYVDTRLEEAKRGLSRSVSKAAGDTLAIVELISKAAGDEYTTWERQEDVKRQMRDARGRFRVMNRPITKTTEKRPLDSQTAQRLLNLNVRLNNHLDPKTAAVYQRDYQQVTQAMRELAESMGDSANTYVQATYSDGSMSDVTPLSAARMSTENGTAEAGLLPVSTYKDGRRVVRIEGVADQDLARNHGRVMGMDALTAMTRSPGFADFATSAGSAYGKGEKEWRDQWNGQENDDPYHPGNRFWRRLGASSKLAYEMGGKYLPPKMQMALKVGEWAGKYQPEAERVLGPSARRAAYRFRGTERTPNPVYQNEIDFLRQTKGSGYEAHKALVGGYARQVPGKRADSGMKEDVTPSRTIQAMKALLPDLGLYELNRKSGTIPPSQGIIIDRRGEVVSESVGYGEDWYVPFDLKNLSKLKGGEYIRTRAFGGLTTEDIYVGLASGARAVTVVSHSGVYTMEFDDNFRGARRYNDKSARMTTRYGQLLDAVKEGGVRLSSIPGDSLEEIQAEAASRSGSPARTGERYERALEEGKEAWLRKPTLSTAATEKVAWDAINQHIIDNNMGNNVDDYADKLAVMAERRGEDPARIRQRFSRWETAAEDAGATTRVEKEIEKETIRLEQSVNPLKLNGRGYDLALQALQQQFPYYISDVKHTPWADLGGVTDKGYVKPRFIRPAGAKAGYYDESITGRGKISADRMYYQNHGVKAAAKDESDDSEPDAQPTAAARVSPGASAPARPDRPAVNIEEDRNKNTMALIRKVRAQSTFSDSYPDPKLAGRTVGNVPLNTPMGLGVIFGNTEDELAAMLNDPARAKEVRDALKQIREKKFFDLSDEEWNATSVGRGPVPESNLDFLAGIGVREYAIKDVEPDKQVGYYEAIITPYLNASYNPVTASLGLTMNSSAAEVAAKVKERAGMLRPLQQAHERVKSGKDLTSNISMSEDEIRKEAMDLATLHAAYKYREETVRAAEELEAAQAALNRTIYVDESGARVSPPEPAPKADAPGEGAEAAAMVKRLKAAAEPYRAEVASMVGMDDVVDQLDMLIAQAAAAKRREALGMKQADRPMSMVFAGSPGTGKTTVAETIAPMYYELGLTKEPSFLELTKKDLVGSAANDIANNTIAQLEQGKGGVIFIDEAYTLNTDDYGREAIDAMIPWMSKNQDTVFIFAGYPEQMRQFRDETNPGLKSRLSTVISFRDYTPAEMVQIADRMMDKGEYKPTPAARKRIEHAIAQIAASKEFNGNGRDVSSFLGRVQSAQNLRLLDNPELDRTKEAEITPSDVDHAIKQMGLAPAPRGRKKAA